MEHLTEEKPQNNIATVVTRKEEKIYEITRGVSIVISLEDCLRKKLKYCVEEKLVNCMSKIKRFYDELIETETVDLDHWSEIRDADCPFCLKFCGNPLCPYALEGKKE